MAAEGSYIDGDDLNDVWGTVNITAWSDLTGGETRDEDRIQRAINYAEAAIENRLRRSRYEVPFVQSSGAWDQQLVNWVATYAGDWLYMRRRINRGTSDTDRTSTLKADVDDEIASVLSGQSGIDIAETSTPNPNAPACVF